MVRVISLEDARERRECFAADARDTTMTWSFFDAHRAPAAFLTNDVAGQIRILGAPLEPREVAVYSSHLAVWQDFLASDAPQVFVFEDDVAVDWRFIEFLARYDFAASGVRFLRLFSKIPSRKSRLHAAFLSRYHGLFRNLDLALGMQAYLLTRDGARILFDHCRVARRPIDQEIDRAWDHGVANLELFPSQVFERFIPSSIGDTRLERDRITRFRTARIAEKLRKLAYRLTPDPTIDPHPPRWVD